jgi:hypothetical protein
LDITVITLVTGERYEISGSVEEVESTIIAASRGSIMQFAWITECASGEKIGVNPASVVSLRVAVTDGGRDAAPGGPASGPVA